MEAYLRSINNLPRSIRQRGSQGDRESGSDSGSHKSESLRGRGDGKLGLVSETTPEPPGAFPQDDDCDRFDIRYMARPRSWSALAAQEDNEAEGEVDNTLGTGRTLKVSTALLTENQANDILESTLERSDEGRPVNMEQRRPARRRTPFLKPRQEVESPPSSEESSDDLGPRFHANNSEAAAERKSTSIGTLWDDFEEFRAYSTEQIQGLQDLALASADAQYATHKNLLRSEHLRAEERARFEATCTSAPKTAEELEELLTRTRGAPDPPTAVRAAESESDPSAGLTSKRRYLYDNTRDQIIEATVKLLLARTQIALTARNWTKAARLATEALLMADSLSFEPLRGKCAFWKAKAEYAQKAYSSAFSSLKTAKSAEGFYVEGDLARIFQKTRFRVVDTPASDENESSREIIPNQGRQ